MPLRYASDTDENGMHLVACECGYWRRTNLPVERVHHQCHGSKKIKNGPGRQLKMILAAAGATPDHRCKCEDRALAMDAWGVDGCRENREVIVKWMKEAAFSRWFTEQARIGWSLANEPWFNPLDPFGSIVDEAIRRADQP